MREIKRDQSYDSLGIVQEVHPRIHKSTTIYSITAGPMYSHTCVMLLPGTIYCIAFVYSIRRDNPPVADRVSTARCRDDAADI